MFHALPVLCLRRPVTSPRPDCPCCVLESVGMSCDESSESRARSVLRVLGEAALAVLVLGFAVGIGICVLLCCMKRKAAKQVMMGLTA